MKNFLRAAAFLFCFLTPYFLTAAPDSLAYGDKSFHLREGIYLNWEQFRSNKPIPKGRIVSHYDSTELGFLKKVTAYNSIVYKDSSGAEQKVASDKIWGFCENASVYHYFSGDYQRITVIGSICHFTAQITTYMYAGSPVGYGGPGTPVTQIEQFVIDTDDGDVSIFSTDVMEDLLQRDEALSKAFKALPRRKKKQSIFLYLRKYNEAHPLYFKK